MSDILSQYGRDSSTKQMSRATNGGQQTPKPTSYSPPQGPKDQMHQGPGLNGGTNHGCCGTQGKY